MSSVTSTNRPKSSRRSKYTAVACLECQRRKNKCSGENECEPCRRRGVRCVYSTNGRHRIQRRQFDEVRDFVNLESRSSTSSSPPSLRSVTLSHSKDQNQHGAGEDEVEPVDANSASHGSFAAPQSMPIPALNSEQSVAEERVRHLEATLQIIAKLSSRSVANSVGSWAHPPKEQVPEQILSGAYNQFALEVAERIPDNISLLSLLAATRRLLASDPNGDSPLLSRPSRQLSPTSVQLPEGQYMRCLFDVCRSRLAMYLPKVEYNEINSKTIQPVLSKEVDANSLLTESRDYLLYSQLYITMSLGRCLQTRENPGRDISEAASFYYQSMSLINDVPSIPAHWVGMSKFHFFRAIYLMQADDLQAAVQAISASLQYAWQSKLNDQSAWPSCNPRESLSRKRLWWAIYCMERRLCQKIGKPSGICDKEVAVDDLVSKEQLMACQDLDVLPEQVNQDDLHLQILVDISRLWIKVWDKFFRAGRHTSNNDEEVDMMSLRISHLHRNVPAIFQWSKSTLESVVEGSELDLQTSRRLVIHVRYTLLRLLVRQNPTRTEPVNLEQATFCHILVSEVVDTLSELIAIYSLPGIASLAYFIASALTECSYHVAAVLHNPVFKAERLAALRTMKKLIESLKLLSPSVKAAQRAYSIFHPQATSAFQSFMNCGETSDDSDASAQFQETEVEAYLQSMSESWPGLPLTSSCLPQGFEGCSAILNEIEIASSDHMRFVTSSGGAVLGLPFSADGTANATDMDELSFPYLYFPDIG